MCRPLHRSLHLLHLRLSSWVSKHTIHRFSGERMSSLSMTTNGSILQDTPASKHTFIRIASIQAIEKARNQWYSKPNSSPYLSSSQNLNGRSLRHFEINVMPHPHKEYPSQPLRPLLCLCLFRRTWSSLLYLFTHKELSVTLLYYLNLMPWFNNIQVLPLPCFFPRCRWHQHQVAFLNDQFHAMLNVHRLTVL